MKTLTDAKVDELISCLWAVTFLNLFTGMLHAWLLWRSFQP
jgi:hypothetical protein